MQVIRILSIFGHEQIRVRQLIIAENRRGSSIRPKMMKQSNIMTVICNFNNIFWDTKQVLVSNPLED